MVATVILSSQQHESLRGGACFGDSSLAQLNSHIKRLMVRQRSEREVYVVEECSKRRLERQERKVRFDVDENDTVKAVVHTIDAVPEDLKHLLYASRKETRRSKKDTKDFATSYARQHMECVRSVERLLNSPLKRSGQGAHLSEQQAMRIIGNSEVRGLEVRMSRLLMRHQRWANQAILDRQAELREEGVKSTDLLLRSRCVQVNRCTQELAQRLAEADRHIAEKIYGESGCMQHSVMGASTFNTS